MYMIVVGGGKVGYHLSRTLINEGHEVLVIERDRNRIEFIKNEMGSICLHGDGCEAAVQADAGTSRADMVIAVTGDDEDNLVACQVAKHKFNVPRTIARITNPNNENLFRMLGVDVTISSTNVIMEYIQQQVPTHLVTHLLKIQDTGVELVEIKVPADSKSIGKRVKELSLPAGSVLMLIIRRDRKPQMAAPDITIQPGDQVIALTPTDTEEQIKEVLRGQE
ncbi:MAG: TrkA family potassium uptake protein [Dehalococcoidales bacterium]|nr:TrkA family potassium uptake protein [Dehalococcoidales bacterium]